MTQIIKIKRKTIRHNPNAGRTHYPVCSPFVTTLVFQCDNPAVIEALEARDYLRITNYEIKIDGDGIDQGTIYTAVSCRNIGELLPLLKKVGIENPRWEMTRQVDFIESTQPEGKYLYSYVENKITCNHCNTKLHPYDLLADAVPTVDGDEAWSNEICPQCGAWGCADFEYEQLEDKEFEKWANKNSCQ